jgi:LacI family transcriptional regulator
MRARSEGFTTAAAVGGQPVSPDLVLECGLTAEGGYEACRALLARGARFDALFAHNDLSAIGAMRALAEAGLTVPDDIAVAGFDDIPAATLVTPALSTVRQPGAAMGHAAATMLLAILHHPGTPPAPVVEPAVFIPRESTLASS